MSHNALIYGKDETTRVVSVEVENDTAVIFRELEDGTIEESSVPYSPYILFTEQHSPKMQRLAGDQPYRWLYEAPSLEKHREVLSASYKKRYDLFNVRDPKEAFLIRSGVTYFKGMKVHDTSVLSFDLEHSYGIGEELKKDGQIFLISTTFRKKGVITKRLFSLDEYPTEAAMIQDWCIYVNFLNPSIILGHNILGHDFPVLRFAAEKNGINLCLGRDGSEIKFNERTSQFRKDGSQSYDYFNALIYGREIVDSYFLAIKYDVARNYESYGLKAIIKHEGLERQGRVHYDASKISKDWQDLEKRKQIKAYAIDDADDALKLFDLMIPSLFYYTQSIPRSFQQIINTATGSQINSLMVRSYLQQSHSVARGSEAVEFEGAISFGVPGIHKNVFKIDVRAMYPSIMRQFKIHNKDKDPQGLFLKVVEHFMDSRIEYKENAKKTGDRYWSDLDASAKVVVNSAYGFLGAPKLNYNFPKGASEVTRRGREILKKSIKWATGADHV